MSTARYVPAAGRAAFTGLYDTVVAATMRERRWRPAVIRRMAAATPTGGRVVDAGAGTGTLAIALAATRGDAEVIAVDGDPAVLRLARRKPGAERVDWREGLADALPLDDGAADAVVMSLLLHHLDRPGKRAALGEAARVLRPGGRLVIADWGVPTERGSDPNAHLEHQMGSDPHAHLEHQMGSDPHAHLERQMGSDPNPHLERQMGSDPSPWLRLGSRVLAVVDGAAGLDDHLAGRLPSLIADAGFELVARFGRLGTVWGTLELLDHRLPTRTIVHITTAAEWKAAREAGVYGAPSLEREGFIHLSAPEQVVRVADAAFRGREALMLLCVDPSRLSAPVRWEAAEDGEAFPHAYGPLDLAAVTDVVPFPEGPSGFALPREVQAMSR